MQVNARSDIGRTTKAFENFGEMQSIKGIRDAPDNLGQWPDLPPDAGFEEKLEGTNPNYELGVEWQINCQRCVPTFEMRLRGYDVTAQPCFNEWDDDLPYFPFEVWENADVKQCPFGDGKRDIEAQMSEWGDGARAQITVLWEGGGGHTFTAIQENGVTKFIDPQTGEVDASGHFDYVRAGKTEFCRIDNLQPSEKMLKCCE